MTESKHCDVCNKDISYTNWAKHIKTKQHISKENNTPIEYKIPEGCREYMKLRQRDYLERKRKEFKSDKDFKQYRAEKQQQYIKKKNTNISTFNKKSTTKTSVKNQPKEQKESNKEPKKQSKKQSKKEPKKESKKEPLYEYTKLGTKQFQCNICPNENKIFTNENGHRKNLQHQLLMKENPNIIRGHEL